MMPHRLNRRWHALVVLCLWGTNLSYAAAQTTNPGTSLLGGWTYVDRNNDGILAFEGEDPKPELSIPNVTVSLYSVTDGIESLLSTTLTDEFGRYYFDNLTAGTYALKQTQPTDYVDGKDTLGTLRNLFINQPVPGGASAGVTSDNAFTGIVLLPNLQGDFYNFGELGMTAATASKRNLLGSSPRIPSPPPPVQTFIPEPTTFVLLATMSSSVLLLSRRRRKN
jgi:hypothetical protein